MLIGLQRALHQPKAATWIIALAIALVLPSLWAGLFADDYGHLLRLTQPTLFPQSHYPDLYNLFVFITDNPQWRELQYTYSLLPWWTDSQLQLVFFRPLAELSHAFDVIVLGADTGLMHLHSLAWYALLLIALYRFYQTVFTDRFLLLLSLLLFAVDASHGFTVAWLANRNALLAGFFVLLTVIFYIQARQTRKIRGLVASSIFFLLALLSAELGISALAFIIAHRVVLDSQKSWRTYAYILPFVVIAAVYLSFYGLYGLGAKGSFYVNPITDSTGFIRHLIPRFFTAFSMQFNLLPLHLLDRFPTLVTVSGVLFFLVFTAYASISNNRLIGFFLLSFSLLVLPVALAPIQERNLLIAGFASCALLALLLQSLLMHSGKLYRGLAITLLVFHLPISALGMLAMSYAPAIANKPARTMAENIPDSWQDKYIISVGVPMFDAAFMPLIHLWQGGVLPKSLWQLSAHTDGLKITPLTKKTWLLENPHGILQGVDFLLRDMAKAPLQRGQRINLGAAFITIKALDTQGVPIAIVLTIDENANSDWLWVRWENGRWQAFIPVADND